MHIFLILFLFLGKLTHAATEPEVPDGSSTFSVSKFALDMELPTEKEKVFTGTPADGRPYYFQAVSLTEAALKSLKAYCDEQKELFEEYQSKTLPSLEADERAKKTEIVQRTLSVLEDIYKSADQWYWDSRDNTLYDRYSDERANDNWIMSILQKDRAQPLMRVCVISNKVSSYTHHIGICHSFARFMDNGETRPKGLAMALHGFAATFMLQRNPLRTHMLTAPTEFMTQMLRETFCRDFTNARYIRGTRTKSATLSVGRGALTLNDSWISRLDRVLLAGLKATSLKAMQALLKETLGEGGDLLIRDLYNAAP